MLRSDFKRNLYIPSLNLVLAEKENISFSVLLTIGHYLIHFLKQRVFILFYNKDCTAILNGKLQSSRYTQDKNKMLIKLTNCINILLISYTSELRRPNIFCN